MNLKMVMRIVAYILLLEIGLMAPACFISLIDGEWNAVKAFLLSFVIIAAVAGLLLLYGRKAVKGRFYSREGLVTTGLTWIFMSALGCLPFVISGEIPNYIDALFEMVSGFTTTGSSILTNVEAMSRGLLWWRSFSHWIGGMGILVFLMAIVSLGGRNSGFTMHIMRAESPGPSSGKTVPRMKDTAKITYMIYAGLTLVDILLLIIVGRMPFFDACCIAFGTAGTGGFGIKADSMGSYTPAAQNITTVFMLLFSVNFTVYYLLLMKKFKDAFKDEEFILFWSIVFTSIVLIVINVRPLYNTLADTVRHSAFTVGTIISTTGYATTDFDQWPSFAKSILLFLMFCGACAGSTGGGMKQVRLLILFKNLRRNIHKFLHPSEVNKVGYNGRVIDEQIIKNVNNYLTVYVMIIILSVLIISLDGFDFETNFSAVMATFNNIGPGFRAVGPTQSFAAYSYLSKIVMIFDMLAGRLEVMPILVLFSRSTWKRAR